MSIDVVLALEVRYKLVLSLCLGLGEKLGYCIQDICLGVLIAEH